MAVVVFVLGGAASGKSSLVRERYVGTLDLYPLGDTRAEHPRDDFSLDRWFNADNEKFSVPLYTNREDDEESLRRFGKRGLGGPTGPRTPEELAEYPQDVRDTLQAFVERLAFLSVEHFAREMLMHENEVGPVHFRRGLTHELSKYVAESKFEGQLEAGPEGGSVVWDAIGNTESYAYWIEIALRQGFTVELVYAVCPLSVARKRAGERRRRLPPSEVVRTHVKAAKAADDLEIMAGTHLRGDRITFERVGTSSEGEEMQAMEVGYGESSI